MSGYRIVGPVRFWFLNTLIVTPVAAMALFAGGFQLIGAIVLLDLLVTGGEMTREGLPAIGLYFLAAYAVGAPAIAIYVAILLEWQRRRPLGVGAAVACGVVTCALVAGCLLAANAMTEGAVLHGFGPLEAWPIVTIIVGVVFMAVWGISVRLRIGVDAASA